MNRRQRTSFFILLLICGWFIDGFAQVAVPQNRTNDPSFKLSITTYNHAEMIFNGISTYVLTDSSISISKSAVLLSQGNDTNKAVFSKRITKADLNTVRAINTDTLQDYYFNNCIMITSGTEYDVLITKGMITKKIHLHCFYIQPVDRLISAINALIPAEYRIDYVSPDIKQDCDL